MNPGSANSFGQTPSAAGAAPAWPRPVVAFMGACTIPGLLTLVAILGDGKIHLDKAVWALLAIAGGGIGWCLGNFFSRGRFGLR